MRPVELTVVVNPYGRSPMERVAGMYPLDEQNNIPARHAHADWMLLYPVGVRVTIDVFAHPRRLNDAQSGVAMEPRTFVVTRRRAFDPYLDKGLNRHWARQLIGERSRFLASLVGALVAPRLTGSPPGPPGGGEEEGGGQGFAGGTAFRDFGSGTRVTLHGEETAGAAIAPKAPPGVDRGGR